MDDLIGAVDLRINQKKEKLIDEGQVTSVGPAFVMVKIFGTKKQTPARADKRNPASVGDWVIIIRPTIRSRWTVSSVFSKGGGLDTSGNSLETLELAPPSGVDVYTSVPGNLVIFWNVPPQQDVDFEVQVNTTPVDSGATTLIYTRGAYAIIPTSTPVYARVRSVSSTFQVSSWSEWVSDTPAIGGTVTSVSLTAPSFMNVSGSPITTSGTLALTLANQTQNLGFFSPNGSTGAPTFRAAVLADLPRGATSGVPLLAQGSGAAPAYTALSLSGSGITGTLPAGNGGTGISSYADGDVLVSDGSAFHKLALGVDGQVLQVDTSASPIKVKWGAGSGYEPLTNGDTSSPELIFVAGDVVMVAM